MMGWMATGCLLVGVMRRLPSTILSQLPLIIAPSPLRRLPSILAHKTRTTHVRRVDHSKDTLLYGEMDRMGEWNMYSR
jgi:hypothetical protein